MSLLAALLRAAFPGLRVLDLAAFLEGGLYPWMPEAMPGVAAPDLLPPAERALLSGFALAGMDPVEDAARAAGAPAAWGGEGLRLVVLPAGGAPAPWLAAGAMALVRPDAATPVGAARIMLLLGSGGVVEQRDLLLTPEDFTARLGALSAAAQAMPGAETGLRSVSPRLAALTLLAPAVPDAPLVLPADRLLLQAEAEGRRLRILLGVLPARPLAVTLRIAGATPALFHDGARCGAVAGDGTLAATILPCSTAPTVLGLGAADPFRLLDLGIAPA